MLVDPGVCNIQFQVSSRTPDPRIVWKLIQVKKDGDGSKLPILRQRLAVIYVYVYVYIYIYVCVCKNEYHISRCIPFKKNMGCSVV